MEYSRIELTRRIRNQAQPGIDVAFRDPVIAQYRSTEANLRPQLIRIIGRAEFSPWPKLFQNLRASRATELAAEHPVHVAAECTGHSTRIADKHYWRVTDADFERARRLQLRTETDELDGNEQKTTSNMSHDVQNTRVLPIGEVGDAGLEPATFWV